MDSEISLQDIENIAQAPYSQEESMAAIKLGFLQGLSEMGIMPSEFERLAKRAEIPFLDDGIKLMGVGLAGGALVGGYSGLLRHRAEKAIEGKGDPEAMKLQNSLRTYQEMIRDLQRTRAVTGAANKELAVAA